jgi:hypothetical protein
MKSDYIIDLERINQLTSSQYDDPKGINQPPKPSLFTTLYIQKYNQTIP